MPSVPRILAVIAAATLICAPFALAREVTIKLSTGQTVTGTLVSQTADSLTIRVNGAERTIPRNQMVGEPQFQLGPAEQYQQKRAQLADDDWAGRYKLAEEIYRQADGLVSNAATQQQGVEAYQIALRELQSILQGNPDMAQAKLLRDLASKRLAEIKVPQPAPTPAPGKGKSKRPQPRPAPGAAPAPAPAPGDAAVPAAGGPPRLLTEEEMNLIKVYELLLDNKPRVMVPRETIDKLLQNYRNDPKMQPYLGRDGEAKLRTMEGWEQVGLMFDLKARELYKDVIVRTEPEVLQNFRVLVHNNYMVRYCGSCHAEGKAAGFYVITKPSFAVPQVAYTNLMLLRRTPTKNNPLLFPERPDQSLLLQYGLPPQDAVVPHPAVDQPGMKWRPFFKGPTDDRFQEMAKWVQSILPEDYPIENFASPIATPQAEPVAVPPQVGGAPAPAPQPAPRPAPGKAAPGKAAPGRTAPKALPRR